MDLWFSEQTAGMRFAYQVKNSLLQRRSEFQEIVVLETEEFGRMMVLDGYVMLTEAHEFVYHEMIAHVPICLHPRPRSVVIIGGGDGGTVTEVVKHAAIEKILLCEIDGGVVDAARQFFPKLAVGFDDPRVEVRIEDGIRLLQELPNNSTDVLIIDSADPVGPGEGLFTNEFYRNVARILQPEGIVVAQSGPAWGKLAYFQNVKANMKEGGLEYQRAYVGSIPCYPFGLWTWMLASQQLIVPAQFDVQRLNRLRDLRYLNAEVFSGAFALPSFVMTPLCRK